jgi:hypothetical protein
MPRIRNVRPEFFANEDLFGPGVPLELALTFAGMWQLADKEGKLEDKPIRIKGHVWRYRPDIDIDEILTKLAEVMDHDGSPGFIIRYSVGGHRFIKIKNFNKHQALSSSEKGSISSIPNPPSDRQESEPNPPKGRKKSERKQTGVGKKSESNQHEGRIESGDVDVDVDVSTVVVSRFLETPSTEALTIRIATRDPEDDAGARRGSLYPSRAYVDELQSAYPELDVLEELRLAGAWTEDPDKKAPTVGGAHRFLLNWLKKAEADRRGQEPGPEDPYDPDDPGKFSNPAEEMAHTYSREIRSAPDFPEYADYLAALWEEEGRNVERFKKAAMKFSEWREQQEEP